MRVRRGWIIGATAVALVLGAGAAQAQTATTYDLRRDWSDRHNPNGPWTYRQGAAALPHDADWTPLSGTVAEYNPASGHIAQPAWAPGNTPGSFLPAWFRSKLTVSSDSYDWRKKDVVVHTTDQFNGGSSGPASVLWTAPSAGTAAISGLVWNARDINRRQTWQLLVNATPQASGDLPGDGTVTRASPTRFKLPPTVLAAGDTVELLIFESSADGAGDLVGAEVKIKLKP